MELTKPIGVSVEAEAPSFRRGVCHSYTYYENYDKYWGNREFKITVYDGVINDLDLEISA